MTDFMWLVLGLALFFALIAWLFRPKTKQVRGDELAVWPFEPMPIMTDSEVLFFHKLRQAVPEFLVFSQVQLSRVIEPSAEAGSDRAFWFNRVCRQSIDFVLVHQDCQTVLAAIELDDWTHDSTARQKQDAKKDKALASAGIPIIRFHAEAMPSRELIRHDVLETLRRFG
ncbi:hypothetical protein B0181_10830 [Moraxella caviae]|uniref:Protein of uncharacterized function (DUF2726) n=1 Tax=Moraxella caviae TaxID=34060 RepID=A0A1S9ZUP3_9GAMM|nr:DUF2726 domain-containing protein [Moraxella caviae]OOR87208.1 hypothetical protein B0181_10830 [Moraxella caviae]STZ09931.1 Protein of uncharacterised function (DUF2726) [Moraxella caviae]